MSEEEGWVDIRKLPKLRFDAATKAMAKHLKSSDFSSREDAATTLGSVNTLQRINLAGFITTNSQEGVISKDIRERAYLSGWMRKKRATEFTEWINLNTDKVAWVVAAGTGPEHYVGIAVTAQREKSKWRQFSSLTWAAPKDVIAGQKKDARLAAREDAVWIETFDPTYGRSASSNSGLYSDILKGLHRCR